MPKSFHPVSARAPKGPSTGPRHRSRMMMLLEGGHSMAEQVTRRDLLKHLGVTIGAAAASAGSIVAPKLAEAQQKFTPKGNIPSTPFKTGHMTFFTGPA